jgi:hypothetical protein
MATQGSTNLDRLEAAGLIVDRSGLPEHHQKVIDALTNDEIDILESIKQRLDAADTLGSVEPRGEYPGFTTFVIF